MSETLSKDYVYELIKGALESRKVLDVCSRYLKYEYLESTIQKKVVKYIINNYNLTGTAPTLGMIAQTFTSEEALGFLNKVKKTKLRGKEDQVLEVFETFIKDIRFQQLYDKLAELYNAEKHDEAYKLMREESEAISNFNIKSRVFTEVFAQWDDRLGHRQALAQDDFAGLLKERLTTGIHEFDGLVKGGYQRGSSFLCMARSGIGKSTYLRWVALCNARLGKKVVLFQGEDTEENAMTALDSAWTGISIEDMETANISEEQLKNINKFKKEVDSNGGKLLVIASEQFDKMTIEECKDILDEIIKLHGPIDMALFDYLEIFSTKGQYAKGESGERRRREDIANKITNLATEYKIVTGTATQSVDIDPKLLNNMDFKMTRHHASEFKGVIKPFSYFFTFNCTEDEYETEQLRMYFDKFRKHKSGQTIKIYQARSAGRFYNAKRTKLELSEFNNQNN